MFLLSVGGGSHARDAESSIEPGGRDPFSAACPVPFSPQAPPSIAESVSLLPPLPRALLAHCELVQIHCCFGPPRPSLWKAASEPEAGGGAG